MKIQVLFDDDKSSIRHRRLIMETGDINLAIARMQQEAAYPSGSEQWVEWMSDFVLGEAQFYRIKHNENQTT